jgi:hypothetical protein
LSPDQNFDFKPVLLDQIEASLTQIGDGELAIRGYRHHELLVSLNEYRQPELKTSPVIVLL